MSESTISTLRLEILEAAREVSGAQAKAAKADRELQNREIMVAKMQAASSSRFSKELAAATRKAAEYERSTESARLALAECEQAAREEALKSSQTKVTAAFTLLRKLPVLSHQELANVYYLGGNESCLSTTKEREQQMQR